VVTNALWATSLVSEEKICGHGKAPNHDGKEHPEGQQVFPSQLLGNICQFARHELKPSLLLRQQKQKQAPALDKSL
jgi:hypothetical protein